MNRYQVHGWWFKSSSSGGLYESIYWSNGDLSCNCPGWTRRVTNNGRSCKHTREILAYDYNPPSAEKSVLIFQDGSQTVGAFSHDNKKPKPIISYSKPEPAPSVDPFARKFNL